MAYLGPLLIYVIIVFSAVIHEYAHGWMANHLGDPTAKMSGRLTLNPLKHIDIWGTVIVPIISLMLANIFIGWAKPVPYNPYNLRDQKHGPMKVGLAGPASNLIIAAVFGVGLRIWGGTALITPEFLSIVALIVYINIFLALFNLIPVPPLDGSKIFGELALTRSAVRFIETSIIGLIIAFILALYLLPPIANFLFFILTGVHF